LLTAGALRPPGGIWTGPHPVPAGLQVALYLGFVMLPMAAVPLDVDGVPKSALRIAIEGRLHFLGII